MKNNESLYIGPKTIMQDWDVSKATAYNIIRHMNNQLIAEHPNALVIPGKVNKFWYQEQCLLTKEAPHGEQ